MDTDHALQIVQGVLSLARRLRSVGTPDPATLAGIRILNTLRRLGPMPAVQLAREEGLQPQSLTRVIGRLLDTGLIARSPSETDGRERILSVTPAGIDVLRSCLAMRRTWLEEAIEKTLDETERRALVDASKALLKLAACDTDRPAARPAVRKTAETPGNLKRTEHAGETN